MDRTWAFARIVTKNHTGSSELTGHGSQRAPTTRIAIANHAATKHKLTEPYAEGETIAAATGEVAETGEVTPMDAPTAGEKVDVASGEAPTTVAETGEVTRVNRGGSRDRGGNTHGCPHCMRAGSRDIR
jgi:hypothetical protein